MKPLSLAFMLLLPLVATAQNNITPGTVLPLRLETGLNAGKIKPGKTIRADLMQDIPGTSIHRGAHVFGDIIAVTPTRLELSFNTLVTNGARIPIETNLRALASPLEIDNAQIPEDAGDRGLPSALEQTTRQVGGEQVYRGGWLVARGDIKVGEPTAYGVLARLNSNPPCHDGVAGNDRPQALWLFSTDACGIYGIDNLTLEHSGRTDPIGIIVLSATSGRLNVRRGSGLLLRVQGP